MATPKSSFPGSESDENNENHSSQEQMVSNSQNQLKKAEKNFMSPTVSTASKVTPKKNVLVERNENLCVESSVDSNANLGGGFRSKPYDSLTNCLSPRPKFLRFDPNRRIEILNRIEKEANEELSESVDFRKLGGEEVSSEDDVNIDVSREMENVVNEEIVDSDSDEDEEEEDEYEEDEEEEERGWCLKGVLKVLFALVACLLSTSYISSMSSSMHLHSQQAVWGFKDGYFMVQNGTTLESVDNILFETGFLVMKENDGYFDSDKIVEDVGNVGNKEKVVEEIVEDGEVDLDALNEELVAIDENIANEIDEPVEIVEAESGFEFELEKVVQLEDADNDESKDTGAYMMENEGEVSHYGSNDNDADEIESADKTDEVLGDGELESEANSSREMFGLENEMQEKESVSSDQEEVINQLRELDGVELIEEHIVSPEKSKNLVQEVDDEMEKQDYGMDLSNPGRSMLFIIGLSVLSIVLASLAFLYRSARVKITAVEESKPVKEMTAEPPLAMERKNISVEEFSPAMELIPEPLAVERKIEFLTSVSTTRSIKEASGSNNNSIHVPTVELLGEIVVGYTKSSNSYRSGDRKDGMTEFEESNSTRYQELSPLPKPLSDPQESFIDEPKNLKRQGGKKVKAAIEVTPVRRSGRIRNRAAAMSP